MHRRALLSAVAGGTAALGLRSVPAVGSAAGSTRGSAGYEPFAFREIDGAAECVASDDGGTAFVAADTGFVTVDVSDPRDPRILAEVRDVAADSEDGPLTSILDVKLDGDRLLVSGPAESGDLQGLVVYDVSDPADPVPATEFFETGYGIHNSFLADGYAYLTNSKPLWPRLVIVDVSRERPTEVARWSPREYDPPDADGWQDLVGLPWGLHDVYVHGDYAYCAYWDAGTWIVDVSDPADPAFVSRIGDYTLAEVVEMASQSGGGNLWELSTEAPGNDHYVATDETGDLLAIGAEGWDVADTEPYGVGGIELYDVSSKRDPEKLGTIDPPRIDDAGIKGTWVTAHNFDLHGDRLYSGWYQAGFRIHDVSDPSAPREIAAWRRPETTAFWGAAYATDETVLTTAYDWDVGLREGLLTFPNRAGEQASPPPLSGSAPTNATTTPGTTAGTATEGTTTDPGTATTSTEGSTTTSTTTGTADPSERETTGQATPGFGVGATLVGLGIGLGAWWRRRSGDD